MDIPNLSTNSSPISSTKVPKTFKLTIIIIIILAITSGFWISRFFPSKTAVSFSDLESNNTTGAVVVDTESLKVNVLYGDLNKNFKDSAIGVIEKGNINGEGTHILNRDGGVTQRASLTSSTVDLDIFVGKKVEVKGETNKSNKTAWLMDVGSIKLLE
ncbi:MAG: hypothetical protein WC895_01480 [Candidatus Shapirobacteria bacterium]|jgi:hypothetical protein